MVIYKKKKQLKSYLKNYINLNRQRSVTNHGTFIRIAIWAVICLSRVSTNIPYQYKKISTLVSVSVYHVKHTLECPYT